MSLGDLFPEELKNEFAKRNIDLGCALLIRIPELKGITYAKYVIIVSESGNNLLLAYVVINSEVNEFVFPSQYLKSLHLPIDRESHDFLDYDSFVNCSEIRTFEKQDVIDYLTNNPEKALGNISKDLLKQIHHTITIATTISKKEKIQFGFL